MQSRPSFPDSSSPNAPANASSPVPRRRDGRYQAVLLDIDGTLVDSNDLHAQAWKEALFDRGFYVPFQKIRRLVGMGGDKLVPALTGLAPDSSEAQVLLRYRTGVFLSRYLPRVKPFPHVRTLLERMRDDDLRLYVATSANAEERVGLLRAAGIEDLLDGAASPDEDEGSKPDPDVVLGALRQAGVERSEAILIGDTSYDIAAAHKASVDVLALRCGGAPESALAEALAIYDDPMDLLENFATSPLGLRV